MKSAATEDREGPLPTRQRLGRRDIPRVWIPFGRHAGLSVVRICLVVPGAEHCFGPLRNTGVHLLHLSKEVGEPAVAGCLRLESVPGAGISFLQSVVEHPHEVAVLVVVSRDLLADIHQVLLTIGSSCPFSETKSPGELTVRPSGPCRGWKRKLTSLYCPGGKSSSDTSTSLAPLTRASSIHKATSPDLSQAGRRSGAEYGRLPRDRI